MIVNSNITLFINQGHRDCIILAVLGDTAIGEYEMPMGTTALIYLKRNDNGDIQVTGGTSYRACPKKWIQAINDAGLEWIGNGQRGRRLWSDAVSHLVGGAS